MFSFFRKSKKDANENSKYDKKNNNKEGPTPPASDQIFVSPNALDATTLLRNNSSEFGLYKNVTNEIVFHNEKNDPTCLNTPTTAPLTPMNCGGSDEKTVVPPISYANMLKKSEPVRDTKDNTSTVNNNRSSVKPCGHGTTAISPRIPIIGNKRENTNTPPGSPKFEIKKPFKGNQTQDTSNSSNEAAIAKRKLSNEDIEKDTQVTASLKLHINIPENDESAMKNLINQEAKFQSQLNDLSKQLSVRDAEATKLRFQMEELQRDVFAKSAGMDRLEAELSAAHKESDIVRQRIRHLENELETNRQTNQNLTDEISNKEETFTKYENDMKAKIADLENVVRQLKERIEELELQLAALQKEKENLQLRHTELLDEREEEKKKVEETLERAKLQKIEIEKKWKDDFEKLRTINILKEQQLLDDFEWKLREVQKSCKERLENKDKEIATKLQEAYQVAELKMKEAEEMMLKIENLKLCENEIEQLRGLTLDQEKALKEMLEQQEQMKIVEASLKQETKRLRNLIEMEKENLQHMQRVHHQEILDKERTLQQTLNQKRNEIAMYWEEHLMRECTRLKFELEQIHNEEKYFAMETVRKQKDEEFDKSQREWENKLRECLKEIASLKRSLSDKDNYYHDEMVRVQTDTDRDIMELRRLMDKIDMTHHERYEKLVQEHEAEIDRINTENGKKIEEIEQIMQNEIDSLRATVDQVREQMEDEAQEKIESLIKQHRSELDAQWENLVHQKSEAIKLVEEEYVNKYNTLEEQFYSQQKSHSSREVELLKTIDTLKNELDSKDSTIDDLQSNIDTLEGGIQVLNSEMAQQGDHLFKSKEESDQKIRDLEDAISRLKEEQENEREVYRLKYMTSQKQSTETITHLQRKCQCLTKLFEEVRMRYERRESRQEDINIISDLRQVIAEQEKDLACLNEEKRYFQMRLMNLERQLEGNVSAEEDEFEDAQTIKHNTSEPIIEEPDDIPPNSYQIAPPPNPMFAVPMNGSVSIPPTIPECDDE